MRGRDAAQTALRSVLKQGRSLSEALPEALAVVDDARERRLAQEIAYGVLRWLPRLDFLLDRLLERPLRPRDDDVRRQLLAGAYQLLCMRVPAHAGVSETVSACRRLGKPWAGGLANAVLRRLVRERDALLAAAEADPVARHAHPRWLVDALHEAWPDCADAIMSAANQHPPMTVRVNLARGGRDDWLARLRETGADASIVDHCPAALVLDHPLDTAALPGFAEGDVSVQDAAAQLAAPLLDVAPGMRVLDACAAPGGKTAHLLELVPEAEVTALDVSGERLRRVGDYLSRIGASARLVQGDAGEPAGWHDGRPFERILLDAPCSATGVIRRHPDIKRHRRPRDIDELGRVQARLLDALWPLLAGGGVLLYATCSILPVENQLQIARFLARTPDASERALDAAWGRPTLHGRQVLPHDQRMDGFYYALLAKS